jgi:C-terminal processing protease CtpA/Prc
VRYTESSDLIEFFIEPEGVQWLNRPIIVLTSSTTLSAAEIQVLSLMTLPHVTLIGEQTYGIFSDMLLKILPNGWEFTLSNEQYLTPEGESYEQTGIPPDIVVNGAEAGFNRGRDVILEHALQGLARF